MYILQLTIFKTRFAHAQTKVDQIIQQRMWYLFACCDNHFATVTGVRSAKGWHIRFRRNFGLEETVEWKNLCRIFDLHPIQTDEDQVFWHWSRLVCSPPTPCIYDCHRGDGHLLQGGLANKSPPIFLWQLIRERLPSAEQVARRNGPSDGSCALCGELEDGDHILQVPPGLFHVGWS
jgi:hypothetical protein